MKHILIGLEHIYLHFFGDDIILWSRKMPKFSHQKIARTQSHTIIVHIKSIINIFIFWELTLEIKKQFLIYEHQVKLFMYTFNQENERSVRFKSMIKQIEEHVNECSMGCKNTLIFKVILCVVKYEVQHFQFYGHYVSKGAKTCLNERYWII